MADMYPSVESLRGVALRNFDGSITTYLAAETQDQSKVIQRCQFVFLNRNIVVTLDFHVAPGIRATIPMTMKDLDVQLTLDGSLFGKTQEGSLVLGPRSQMGELWVHLLQGDVATIRAIACEVFGHEMPFACQGCKDGPFPLCVADRNNACSNCIYTGSDRFCHWRKWSDHGAVGEEEYHAVDKDHDAINQDDQGAVDEDNHDAIDDDHAPPKIQRPSSPFTEYFHVPPWTQRAGRKRSNTDSDSDLDPDFVPPKRRKSGDSDDMHDYVPPKTRSTSSIDSKHDSPALNRERRSTAESDSGDAEPYEVIDLTGDD